MEFPKTSKALQRFLGTINYYRRWIPNAAELRSPLNCLLNGCTRKERPILITPEVVEAFDKCKSSLLNVARLTYPEPHSKLSIATNASDITVGGVLQQLVDNEQQSIGFFSKELTGTERRYSTYDRELRSIYKILHFQHFLEGRTFTIFCNHKPLIYASQKKKTEKSSPRQARQLDLISQYSTSIQYIYGINKVPADMLSKIATISCKTLDSSVATAQANDPDLQKAPLN